MCVTNPGIENPSAVSVEPSKKSGSFLREFIVHSLGKRKVKVSSS